MKTRNKALLLSLCAVLLVATSVFGTMAYLTSTTDTVENTFTVGKVTITLDEALVNEYGEALKSTDNPATKEIIEPDVKAKTVADAARVLENDYKLIPGHTYVKDPTVTVKAGSEESYVRMKVTINKVAALKAIFGENFLPQNYVTGWNNSIWVSTEEVTRDNDTATYEFRYYQTVDASKATYNIVLEALFSEIKIPGTVTQEQLATIEGLEINVIAEAIQADGFANEQAAWDAFN